MSDFSLNPIPAPIWHVATIVCGACKNRWVGVFPSNHNSARSILASDVPVFQCPNCKEAAGVLCSYHGLEHPIREIWTEGDGPLAIYDPNQRAEESVPVVSELKTVDDFLGTVFPVDTLGDALND